MKIFLFNQLSENRKNFKSIHEIQSKEHNSLNNTKDLHTTLINWIFIGIAFIFIIVFVLFLFKRERK